MNLKFLIGVVLIVLGAALLFIAVPAFISSPQVCSFFLCVTNFNAMLLSGLEVILGAVLIVFALFKLVL